MVQFPRNGIIIMKKMTVTEYKEYHKIEYTVIDIGSIVRYCWFVLVKTDRISWEV